MSILTVENLVKTYGEKTLFNQLSFSISEKQRIGLIGVNGTGKSTLLRVIAGLETVEAGEVIHSKQLRIEYLPQYPTFDEELSVLEQIYNGNSPIMQVLREYEQALSELEIDVNNNIKQEKLSTMQQRMDAMNAWEASTVAKTVLTHLGIKDMMQPVKELSGGQKKRVAIAKALIQPADLFILDEPTNHLDNELIEWLESYLSQYKGTILVVTHDRYFLNRVTNQIFELDQGNLYRYEGNYESYLEKKAEREEQLLLTEKKRKNLLRHELAWLRRGAKARTTKQKARIQRIEQAQNEKTEIVNDKLDIAIGAQRLGKKVIELNEITKSFGEIKLINHLSYLVLPNERLGIIGPNGSGKSTLLNIMAGITNPDDGYIERGQTVKIAYYTQDYIEMNENLRVIDYIKEVAEIIKIADGQTITVEQMLERFLFPGNLQWTYIRKLSGGERRRLYLLRTLIGEPNVLFLDEPTNDLDTTTLTILEDYLEQFPGVVITVSHDRFFLDRVIDHLLVFEGNGNIQRFEGNYTEYLETIKQEKEKKIEAKGKNNQQNIPPKKETRKKLSYKEQKEWVGIEDVIATLEERREELQKEIEQAGSDLDRVQHAYQEQQKLEKDLEQAMERWTELSLLIEEIEKTK